MGRNCVREVLRHAPQQVVKIYSSSTSGGDGEISQLVAELGIEVETLTNDALTTLVDSGSHQSYVALLKERRPSELKEFLAQTKDVQRSLVVMVDTINDPQNFGSILRASECFAVDAVIWSKNRGVGVTPVVSKASVGASELVSMLTNSEAPTLALLTTGVTPTPRFFDQITASTAKHSLALRIDPKFCGSFIVSTITTKLRCTSFV